MPQSKIPYPANAFVRTVRFSGGDYNSLSDWEAAFGGTSGDLISDGVSAVAECYNDFPGGDQIALINIDGWAASGPDNRIIVQAADGSEVNGNGYDSGYHLVTTQALGTYEPYTDLIGIGLYNSSAGSFSLQPFNTNQRILNCYLQGDLRAMRIRSADCSVRNTICVASPSSGSYNLESNTGTILENVTVIGGTYPVLVNATGRATNCIAYGTGTNDFSGTGVGSSNNASSDGTEPGTAGYSTLVEADFENFAGGDYHLSATSAVKGLGANIYAAETNQWDIDWDEYPSAGAWDIGADYTPSAGGDTNVEPTTEVLIIETPQVQVQFLSFTTVDVNTATVVIETPQVEVEVFKDTFIDPVTEVLIIETPQVEVFAGNDVDITPATETLVINSPQVGVDTPVEFLVATEAQPLEYTVTVGGVVQMTSQTDAITCLAWRNEIGDITALDPFPAVISVQPEDDAVVAPAPASFSVTATGATAYQWYVDDVPQIDEVLSTFTINPTSPGTYLVRCVVFNASGIGISSKDATLTVT